MRERPFDPGATLIALPSLLTRIPSPGRLDRFKALLRRQMQAAPGLRGPEAQRPGGTGTAVLEAEAHNGRGLALAIAILPPHGRDLALGAVRLPLLPIHRELVQSVGPLSMSLPPLARPCGAAPRAAVVVAAGDEHVRAHIGGINEMFLRREIFLLQGRMDRCGALGRMDCRGGCVHLREEVGRGGLTRLADVHHVPSPLRVAFVPIACLRIIGGFDPFRCGRQVTIGLEADAGDGRMA